MLNEAQIKEFGFKSFESFPRRIDNQEITLTLPTADVSVEPIAVEISAGVLVPVQLPSSMQQGMIIAEDGCVVSISQQGNDPEAELQVQFVEEVPYDARVEIVNVMRRAVMLDKELEEIWVEIEAHWVERFPPSPEEVQRQAVGRYDHVDEAWQELGVSFVKLLEQIESKAKLDRVQVQPQVVVQSKEEFERGWQGTEVVIDRLSLSELDTYEMKVYLKDRLGGKLREHLADPLYDPQSTFALYYEARLFPTVKLVVIPRS